MPLQVGTGSAFVRFDQLIVEGANGPGTANVYVWGSAHDIELTRCEVRRSARQGFFSESTTRSILISRCYFHDNGGAGPKNLDHGVYMEGARHVIANCIITGTRNGFGIQLYPASDHVLITNNTIVNNRSGVVVGGEGERTTTQAFLVNNIVAFNLVYGVTTYWGDGSLGSHNVARNNLVFGNGERDVDDAAGGMVFVGNLVRNPRFVSAARRDYHLRAGSPAIDRATARYSPDLDFEGRRRRKSRPPDLGALEGMR